MINFSRAVLAAACFLVTGCSVDDGGNQGGNAAGERAQVAPVLNTPDAVDIHSFAKPHEARVTHVALDLAVDFAARRVGGTATLDIQKQPNAKQIVLDDK